MTFHAKRLAPETIERKAEELLRAYQDTSGTSLRLPVPVEDITTYHLALRLEFGHLNDGRSRDVLGALVVDQERVIIDDHLNPSYHPGVAGRYRFSIGHEVGHWELHKDLVLREVAKAKRENGQAVPAIVCRSGDEKLPIEWQADYFSACLLMPQLLVFDIWQRRFGSLRPLIYSSSRSTIRINGPRRFRQVAAALDQDGYDEYADGWAAYFASQFFNVSTQAMRIRLETLGLLHKVAPVDIAS